MMSLRLRLFLLLVVATAVIWLFAVLWIQNSTRAEVERVLDARLAEAGQMVSSLLSDRRIDIASAASLVTDAPETDTAGPLAGYSHRLTCQIWTLDGDLVGRSDTGPMDRLTTEESGFGTTLVDGEPWRVFSVVNEDLGVRVMVGDAFSVRDRLVRDVITGFVLPGLLVLPFLAGIIWFILWHGFRVLESLASGLSRRSAMDLSPVAADDMPREIRPLGEALNGLFQRVTKMRDREMAFTSYAAHELKTPLAGIRTQAQVAAMAPDEATRTRALTQIQRGVQRTDRMVRQLLDMALVDHAEKQTSRSIDICGVLEDVVQDLQRLTQEKNVRIAIGQAQLASIPCDEVLLTLALRNLLENAIAVSPPGEVVEVEFYISDSKLRIEIRDRGPGIPNAEANRITERFYRIGGSKGNGSGLGLPIVTTALKRLGGKVTFSRRIGGGEIASIELSVEISRGLTE